MISRRFIRSPNGEELVVLARRDYDELVARAQRLPAKDEQTSEIAEEIAREQPHLPAPKHGRSPTLPRSTPRSPRQ